MITSFNFYYAQPGDEAAVLRQRLFASDVRETLAIPRGRVLRRTAGAATLPDVMWELQFAEIAGHHADMAVRAASSEFEAVRAGMRKLCRRFERPLFDICADTLMARSPGSPVVTLEWIFCAPDRTEKMLAALRPHISTDAPGRLMRLTTPGNDLPQLLWQREYADSGSAQARAQCSIELLAAERVEASVWVIAWPKLQATR